MAIQKKKFIIPFGLDSEEDSIFRKAASFMGDLTFGTAARFFIPEGNASTGATNQCRINPGSDEMEIFRGGRWIPVATSAMRYDSANTSFLGNTGTGEVVLPHVASDDYLKNVPKYQAANRGTAALPSYGFSQDSNTGMYSSGAETLDFSINGDRRLSLKQDSILAIYDGDVTFEANRNGVITRQVLTAAERFVSNKSATFNDVITAKKKITVTTGGVEIQGNSNLNISGTGQLIAGGNVVAYSDKRIKSDIKTIEDAVGLCSMLRGTYYHNDLKGQYEYGLIAQELEEVMPEMVESIIAQGVDGEVIDDFKAVKYLNMVGVLLQAVNELNIRITELESKNEG